MSILHYSKRIYESIFVHIFWIKCLVLKPDAFWLKLRTFEKLPTNASFNFIPGVKQLSNTVSLQSVDWQGVIKVEGIWKINGDISLVAATSGLQISTDAENWKTLITNTDITGASWTGNKNMLPSELAPVSTGGETDANGNK